MEEIKTKVCSKCHDEKPLTEFSKNKNKKDGLREACKKCLGEMGKERRRIKNEEKWKNLSESDALTRRKMSESQKKYYGEHPERAESVSKRMEGHIVSETTCNKISVALTGYKYSKQTCKQMSISAKKRWEKPEERKKASENQLQFLENHPEHIEFLKTNGLGRKHTIEARRKMGLRSMGENNPRWNDGITPLRKQIHECFKMTIWRESVFARDNYRDWFSGCAGTRENPIQAHHIVYLNKILKKYNIKTLKEAEECEELWDINNGITILKKSHDAYHDMWGRI
jgi:hypothetical protein